MKNIILVLALLSSFSSFASLTNKDATDDETRDAIVNSLRSHDLNCETKGYEDYFTASQLPISEMFKEKYSLSVVKDGPQSFIKLKKVWTDKRTNVLIAYTDKQFNKITKLIGKSYDAPKMIRVNNGSILSPVYTEKLTYGEPVEYIDCK